MKGLDNWLQTATIRTIDLASSPSRMQLLMSRTESARLLLVTVRGYLMV